jgi:zinc protease
LRFDTSDRIDAQLMQIQLDDLGIDYINKRVAKQLLDGGMLITMVGRRR